MSQKAFGPDEFINEQGDAEYFCRFHDASAPLAALNAAAITAIKATLRDVATNEVLNDRLDQDVLDTNGGTLANDGGFTLKLSPEDNVIIRPKRSGLEQHRLTLVATYDKPGASGTGQAPHVVTFFVREVFDL